MRITPFFIFAMDDALMMPCVEGNSGQEAYDVELLSRSSRSILSVRFQGIY
jgi:hypothetical protein